MISFDGAALPPANALCGASENGKYPAAIEKEICRQYRVRPIGELPDVRERYYAISVERKLKHPAVVAISETAREKLFV